MEETLLREVTVHAWSFVQGGDAQFDGLHEKGFLEGRPGCSRAPGGRPGHRIDLTASRLPARSLEEWTPEGGLLRPSWRRTISSNLLGGGGCGCQGIPAPASALENLATIDAHQRSTDLAGRKSLAQRKRFLSLMEKGRTLRGARAYQKHSSCGKKGIYWFDRKSWLDLALKVAGGLLVNRWRTRGMALGKLLGSKMTSWKKGATAPGRGSAADGFLKGTAGGKSHGGRGDVGH